MTLAVLQRHAKVKLHTRDVYAATVGGGRVNDPAGDLATAVAVASAARDEPPVQRVAAFGEISLSGEVRPVPGLERRLDEAARLGVVLALVPLRSATRPAPPGLTVLGVETVADALAAVLGHDRAAVVPLGARKVAG